MRIWIRIPNIVDEEPVLRILIRIKVKPWILISVSKQKADRYQHHREKSGTVELRTEPGSVADPDPGSGAFLSPGSGKKSRSGLRIRDEQTGSCFRELRNNLFGLKYLNS
jgi:hypothetical protein